MPVEPIRLRAGRTRGLVRQLFLSEAFLGIAISALAAVHIGYRAPLPIAARVVAFSIAAAMFVVGVFGALRSTRLGVYLTATDVTIVRVIGRRRIPLVDVSHVGFGSGLLERSLYFISTNGVASMALGVSTPPGREPSEDASDALKSVRDAIETSGADFQRWAPDPLPELPEEPLAESGTPPPDATFEDFDIRPVFRVTVWSQALAGVSILVVGAGFQAALPHSFPWILICAVLLIVLETLPGVIAYRRLILPFRPALATTDDQISVRTRKGWKQLDLNRLVGVGGTRVASRPGIFGPTVTATLLRLVDSDGHRLVVEEPVITTRLLGRVRDHLGDGVVTTELAKEVLEA